MTQAQQIDRDVPDSRLAEDAVAVMASWLALWRPDAAFDLLEYLHSAAANAPDQFDSYMRAADEIRESLGIGRVMR